ncbi:MAG TPA: adenosylcobinamide-GDP ribazoletransferase [Nitrospirae bacterium]|nr:cobalamin synthase [bacterium BMS3Bbin05]HDO21515.1 adenosylcobinamide-GDP ribazoletransferase [Nitrospirota bacterium]HDO36386.1 adenosylcobinamide-GDP ribazoletransferase [Nitrospirota bacterium]HDZ88183.1 adenosylcobinamide-GDP ribazoletransferase [Nitrospirota bacterium]
MKKLILAFSFLTIIPMPHVPYDVEDKDVGNSAVLFPVVGLFQGLLLVLLHMILLKVVPVEIAAGLLIVLLVISNGGFHLDGLSDTFDALASRKDRERMLDIMKGSTAGPVGVVSIVLVILLKYLLLKNVLTMQALPFYIPLILFPVFGRWVMVPAMYHGRSARHDGLGRTFIENTGIREYVNAFVMLGVITAGIWIYTAKFTPVHVLLPVIFVPLAIVYAFGFLGALFCNYRFGGLTGDNLGAISEIGEILFLLSFLVVSACK